MNSLDLYKIKCDIFSRGVFIDNYVQSIITQDGKNPITVRPGISEGIEIVIGETTYINAPINPMWSDNPLKLITDGTGNFMIRLDNGSIIKIKIIPKPLYYNCATPTGTKLIQFIHTFTDRVCISPKGTCWFRNQDNQCRFCHLGTRKYQDTALVPDEIIFAVEKAVNDPVLPAKHILVSGGTPGLKHSDFKNYIDLFKGLKDQFDIPLYFMTCPPQFFNAMEIFKNAGVDEIGINIEIYNTLIAKQLIPGKARMIGRDTYFKTLINAVGCFGKTNVRSILIVGLEPFDSTLDGVRNLASIGVAPILSPFRPVRNTALESHPVPTGSEFYDVLIRADGICHEYDVFLGPACYACQNNTLNLDNDRYHFY